MMISKVKYFALAGAVALSGALGMLAAGTNPAMGQDEDATVWTYEWTAPTTGAPVAWYLVEVVANQRDTLRIDRVADTQVAIPVTMGQDYAVRVAAFDALGRRGPWSPWSMLESCEQPFPTNNSGAGDNR